MHSLRSEYVHILWLEDWVSYKSQRLTTGRIMVRFQCGSEITQRSRVYELAQTPYSLPELFVLLVASGSQELPECSRNVLKIFMCALSGWACKFLSPLSPNVRKQIFVNVLPESFAFRDDEGAVCVYMYIYIYLYIYMCVHVYIFINWCMYWCMHVCMYVPYKTKTKKQIYIYIHV